MKNGWIKLINNKIQAKKNLETSIKNGEKTSFLNSEDIQHRIRKAELEEHITVVNSIFQFENIENAKENVLLLTLLQGRVNQKT